MKYSLYVLISVAIDLIVQHIREFLNNRQKAEALNSATAKMSNHIPVMRVNSGDGHLKRPH